MVTIRLASNEDAAFKSDVLDNVSTFLAARKMNDSIADALKSMTISMCLHSNWAPEAHFVTFWRHGKKPLKDRTEAFEFFYCKGEWKYFVKSTEEE